MTTKFDILNNFKGFGNPNANIWFVGLEEALDFESDIEDIVKLYSKEFIPIDKNSIKADALKFGRYYTKVYNIMAKIIVGLFSLPDWKEYRNERLLQIDSNEFQMNLYPLGKKSINSWNMIYQEVFGLKAKMITWNTYQISDFQY
jgi:hypothetical protein